MKKWMAVLLICVLGLLTLFTASAEEVSPKLVLSEAEVRIAVGKNVTLKATVENPPAGKKARPVWESSDPAVCTVSASGAVKAVSEGTAVIKCTQELPEGGALTAECRVTTFVASKSLKPVNKDIRLNVGETAQAECTLLPEETTEKTLDWNSADEAVVTVDTAGKLTAVGPGTVKVTAQTKDGSNKKAVFTVYVPTLAAAETEYTISEMSGITVPVAWYGTDFDKNISFKTTGKPVRITPKADGNRLELLLEALEAGDSTVEISDKADKKAKITLTVHTEESAVWNSFLVELTSVQFRWDRSGMLTTMGAVNHSDQKVANLEWYIDFRTASGEQVFFPATFEGNDIPCISHAYRSYPFRINPHAAGKRSSYLLSGSGKINDREITEIRCAIRRIVFEDDTSVWIPDGQLYWVSSEAGPMEIPQARENYVYPSQELKDKSFSVDLGCRNGSINSFTKSWYESPVTGLYVTHVEPGSISERCGLQLKDIIFEVDGISYAENEDMLFLGRAKMADGETVIFKILRDGKVMELEFHQ